MDARIEAILQRELAALQVAQQRLVAHIEVLDKNRRSAVELLRTAQTNLTQMTTDIAAIRAALGM